MPTPAQKQPTLQTSRKKRKGLKIGISLILLLICGFFGAQFGGRIYLQKWLVENGADSATINSIRINPFTGTAALNGVDIKVDGKTVMGNSTIFVNVGLKQLFGHEALLQEVTLQDLQIDIEQYDDGSIRIGSYSIAPSDGETADGAPDEAEETQVPWIFSTSKVSLKNLIVRYKRPDLDIHLVVDQGSLENFTTDATRKSGHFSIKGSLNDAPIVIDLQQFKIAPSLELGGKLHLEGFDLAGLSEILQSALPRFGGVTSLAGEVSFKMLPDNAISAQYDGRLNLDQIGVGQEGWNADTSTTWDGKVDFGMNESGMNAQTDGRLALGTTSFEMGEKNDRLQIGGESITWRGGLRWQQQNGQQQLDTDGKLEAQGLHGDIAPAEMKFRNQSLSTSVAVVLPLDDPMQATGSVNFGLSGTEVDLKGEKFLQLGGLHVTEVNGSQDSGVQIANLSTDNLELPASATIPVGVRIAEISLNGLTSADLKSLFLQSLSVNGTEVRDQEGTSLLAAIQDLEGHGIELTDQYAVRVKEITGSNSRFMQDEGGDPMATLGSITLDTIDYGADGIVSVNQVDLAALRGGFTLQKKETDSAEPEPTVAEAVEEKAASQPAEPKGVPVKIGTVRVDTESRFTFTDASLATPFVAQLDIQELEVADIDLTDVSHPFNYSLKGSVNQYAPLLITGECAPLKPKVFLSQETKLRNFPMQSVSPYTVKAIGTFFPSGRLDLTSTLHLDEAVIDMKNNLLFKELKAETVDGELADQLNNQLPVPLDLALSMLRDSDDNIDLDIPLDGELSSMNIGIADVLITALSKGITVAVAPYLAYTALGPTGALIFAGAKLGQALINTDLPTLEYQPGVAELTEEQLKLLAEIGPSIKKKSEENYSICSKINKDEFGEQAGKSKQEKMQQLFSLGEQRSNLVKKYLVSTFDIAEEQLLICNPSLNFEEGAAPVVEFKK